MFLIAKEIVAMADPIHQLAALGMYMATVIGGLAIHGLIVLPLILLVIARINPIRHFLGASQALVTALGTDSSSATLPVTIRCMEDKCGYDRRIARFVCPLGATINMNGSGLYEAVASIYITQVLGKDLGVGQLILVSLTATLAAVGAAGIPQAGLVTLLMVLTAVDLPPEYAALIIPVDWLLDRVRTVINVFGDTVGCALVHKFVAPPYLHSIPSSTKRRAVSSWNSSPVWRGTAQKTSRNKRRGRGDATSTARSIRVSRWT